jgi:hypothetical protein
MDTILQSPVVMTTSSSWGKRLAVLKRAPKVPLAIVLLSILVAILAPVIAPHSAIDSDLRAASPRSLSKGGAANTRWGRTARGAIF